MVSERQSLDIILKMLSVMYDMTPAVGRLIAEVFPIDCSLVGWLVGWWVVLNGKSVTKLEALAGTAFGALAVTTTFMSGILNILKMQM